MGLVKVFYKPKLVASELFQRCYDNKKSILSGFGCLIYLNVRNSICVFCTFLQVLCTMCMRNSWTYKYNLFLKAVTSLCGCGYNSSPMDPWREISVFFERFFFIILGGEPRVLRQRWCVCMKIKTFNSWMSYIGNSAPVASYKELSTSHLHCCLSLEGWHCDSRAEWI